MRIIIRDGQVSALEPTAETAVLCLAHLSVALSFFLIVSEIAKSFARLDGMLRHPGAPSPFLTVTCVRTCAAAGSFSDSEALSLVED